MPQQRVEVAALESIPIDKDSSIPAYLQIAEGLKAVLRGGAFPAGYPLPPERVMCEMYGVSRMTLRQATSILDREGLVVCQRGRGTFVAHPRLRKQQQELRSFTEEIRARGGRAESRIISFDIVTPTREAAEFFGLSPDAKIYEVCRLRLNDGAPLAVERVRLPHRLCPNLERFDLEKNSLYRILEESYRLTMATCLEEISAEIPSAADRKLLDMPKGGAVLVVNRQTFTDIGQALEQARAVYRGDSYSAIVHSVRPRKA